MSEDVKATLEARKAELEKEFELLREEQSGLSRKVSEIQTRLVQLQGSYTEVNALLEPKASAKRDSKKK